MRGPLGGVLAASVRRVVDALALLGVGREVVRGRGVPGYAEAYQKLAFFGILCRNAVFSIGRMVSSWCRGSRGVVGKVPERILTASFWTVWSFFTKVICLPLYQS